MSHHRILGMDIYNNTNKFILLCLTLLVLAVFGLVMICVSGNWLYLEIPPVCYFILYQSLQWHEYAATKHAVLKVILMTDGEIENVVRDDGPLWKKLWRMKAISTKRRWERMLAEPLPETYHLSEIPGDELDMDSAASYPHVEVSKKVFDLARSRI